MIAAIEAMASSRCSTSIPACQSGRTFPVTGNIRQALRKIVVDYLTDEAAGPMVWMICDGVIAAVAGVPDAAIGMTPAAD